jgi:ribosome-binding factor A
MRKVNETLREIIAEEIAEIADSEMGFVTVTAVDTAPDLRSGIVFYTVLGTDEQQVTTADRLERSAPRLQAEIARQARLKYTPRLRFVIDNAVERGVRINAMLLALESDTGSGEREDGGPDDEE